MRYLTEAIETMLGTEDKMIFISGPRQVGKTTLARSLLRDPNAYFNWDIESHRLHILKYRDQFWREPLPGKQPLRATSKLRVVLDEIHKYPRWKRLLKGVYDGGHNELELIVTGSGRLDVYQRGGDSLFGRYALMRLSPFSVGEVLAKGKQHPLGPDEFLKAVLHDSVSPNADTALQNVEQWTGFPEPLFAQNMKRLTRWKRARKQLVFKEDLRDLTQIRELGLVEQMTMLLPERVGSLLSVNALREDVGVAYTTVQGWISALERLYYHFELRPYAGKLNRTLKREGKLYLFDSTDMTEPGPRFENVVAVHLRKLVDTWNDFGEGEFNLHFVRDKEKREVDFLITRERKPWLLLEAKLTETQLDTSLKYFHERLHPKASFQLVRNESRQYINKKADNIWAIGAARALAHI